MAYLEQGRRASPGSIVAVVGIHAGMAAALVLGLSVTGTIPEEDIFGAIDFPIVEPPPPDPNPPEQAKPNTAKPADKLIIAPKPPLDIPLNPATIETTDIIPDTLPPLNTGTLDPVVPSPVPTLDPVRAAPRNNPGAWVTTNDYRTVWIRREMVGTARFRLDIAANGRVTDCTITSSTGHAALDKATCELVTKRARFEPARGGQGEPVAGTYSSAVRWELPD